MRSDRTNCRIPAREENSVEGKGQENIPKKILKATTTSKA